MRALVFEDGTVNLIVLKCERFLRSSIESLQLFPENRCGISWFLRKKSFVGRVFKTVPLPSLSVLKTVLLCFLSSLQASKMATKRSNIWSLLSSFNHTPLFLFTFVFFNFPPSLFHSFPLSISPNHLPFPPNPCKILQIFKRLPLYFSSSVLRLLLFLLLPFLVQCFFFFALFFLFCALFSGEQWAE